MELTSGAGQEEGPDLEAMCGLPRLKRSNPQGCLPAAKDR